MKKAEDTSVHVLLECLSSFLLFEFKKEKLLNHREGIYVTLQKSTEQFSKVVYYFTPIPVRTPEDLAERSCCRVHTLNPEGKV